MRIKRLVFPFTLLAALVLVLPTALADTAPPAAASPGWSPAEVMALIALIVAAAGALIDAARAILHFTAPRTKSTWDDNAAAALDRMHARVAALEVLVPRPPPAPTTPDHIGMLAIVVLAIVAATTPACATVK